MARKLTKRPLALALGAAFSLGGAAAHASVFQVTDLASGYQVAQTTPATPAKPAQKAGEMKCGAECIKKMRDKGKNETEAKAACDKAKAEGKCGEGKCGEGKCGGSK